jgi:hypothetical protein
VKISSINHNQYALEKINPNRFVYHLSYKKNRNKIENKSIIAMLKNKEDKRGLLFAHNDELLTTGKIVENIFFP